MKACISIRIYSLTFRTDQLVWKGRLCAQDQLTYDRAMNHIISEFQQQPCSSENCDLCSYRSMTDAQIASELNGNCYFSHSITYVFLISFVHSRYERPSIYP